MSERSVGNLQVVVYPVYRNLGDIFLEAVHSASLHTLHHVFVTVVVRNIHLVNFPLLLIQFFGYSIKILTWEVPGAHSEVLQDF